MKITPNSTINDEINANPVISIIPDRPRGLSEVGGFTHAIKWRYWILAPGDLHKARADKRHYPLESL